LCSSLGRAEDEASIVREQTGVVIPADPSVRKRRRDSTPPEELKRNDEKRFRTDEKRAEDQATKDDSSYKAGSTSEPEST
jgi:hypothetical protein